MFTDTHFHLHRLFELGCDCVELLSTCAKHNFPFLLDIGTDFDDLPIRLEISQKVLNKIQDESLKNKYNEFIKIYKKSKNKPRIETKIRELINTSNNDVNIGNLDTIASIILSPKTKPNITSIKLIINISVNNKLSILTKILLNSSSSFCLNIDLKPFPSE